MSLLQVDLIHAKICKPKHEKFLTRPTMLGIYFVNASHRARVWSHFALRVF